VWPISTLTTVQRFTSQIAQRLHNNDNHSRFDAHKRGLNQRHLPEIRHSRMPNARMTAAPGNTKSSPGQQTAKGTAAAAIRRRSPAASLRGLQQHAQGKGAQKTVFRITTDAGPPTQRCNQGDLRRGPPKDNTRSRPNTRAIRRISGALIPHCSLLLRINTPDILDVRGRSNPSLRSSAPAASNGKKILAEGRRDMRVNRHRAVRSQGFKKIRKWRGGGKCRFLLQVPANPALGR